MNAPTRELILIRHAQAADVGAGTDHDRTLTERGRADAESMGNWLRESGIRVDLVLCSTAARTRETWAGIVASSGLGALVEHDQRIYNATPDQLLQVVREEGGSGRTIALVGHAPGVPGLAAGLLEGSAPGPQEAEAVLAQGFPTCTAAVLDVDVRWKQLAPGTATLQAAYTARGED